MTCFHPLSAFRTDTGEIVFADRGGHRPLTLPCGQCIGCRLERSRQWAVRCMHESSMHEFNSFVTLTYDDDHIPSDMSLNYRHFQLFMKRVRARFRARVRFYMCGEYGEVYKRPHYHACLFGLRPDDLYPWRKSGAGFQLYRSPVMEDLWRFGSVEVGDVTFESAAYVARYIMKKVTGDRAEAHYSAVDGDTGEIFSRVPEFTRMSLKPGIGFTWFEKYRREVFPLDRVVVRGVECKPPKYYKLLLDADSSKLGEQHAIVVENKRYADGLLLADDNTDDRLKVKEDVCIARIKNLKRSVE